MHHVWVKRVNRLFHLAAQHAHQAPFAKAAARRALVPRAVDDGYTVRIWQMLRALVIARGHNHRFDTVFTLVAKDVLAARPVPTWVMKDVMERSEERRVGK